MLPFTASESSFFYELMKVGSGRYIKKGPLTGPENTLQMGRVTGFEPATSSTTSWRSNLLSYTRHRLKVRRFMTSKLIPSSGKLINLWLLHH